MRTSDRLRGLKKWAETELCAGRLMKSIPESMDIGVITRQEPRVFLAWQPGRADRNGFAEPDPVNVVPSITIMPGEGHVKYVEEKHFDRYKNIHRGQELGRELTVTLLFSVYEPGVRMPGFVESVKNGEMDMSLLREGTEEGLFTLLDWMDECQEKLTGTQYIPGTDLFFDEGTATYSLYTDQNYVVDKRPVYYGYINARFYCYAEDGNNDRLNEILI